MDVKRAYKDHSYYKRSIGGSKAARTKQTNRAELTRVYHAHLRQRWGYDSVSIGAGMVERKHAVASSKFARAYVAKASKSKQGSSGMVKAHSRKTKSGKVVSVKAHPAGKRGTGRKSGGGKRRR